MDVIEIPFVKTVGLSKSEDGLLKLEISPSVYNHIGTMHASAQFTLAETASGQLLIDSFPDLEGKVVPLLRDSQIKFKRPAETSVTAQAMVSNESIDNLLKQLDSRGRGSIDITVEVKDSNKKTTCTGVFSWYIQNVA